MTTKKWPQYLAGASAAGGALAVGTALGWASPVEERYLDPNVGLAITEAQWSWVASVITLACGISCLPIGFLMKKFGRKWTMITLVLPFVIGWCLIIWAQGFIMLLVGRIFLGLAGGAFCISAPQYSSEIAEKEIRGFLGTFFQLLINIGILFVYCIGPFLSIEWTSAVCGIVAILFGVIFLFMPESPVYLVTENRIDDATNSYKWLRGSDYDPQGEIDILKEEIDEQIRNQTPMGEVFARRSTKMAMLVGFGLMLFQQMSGINVVIFFSTRIFIEAGIESPELSTIALGSINVIFTLVGSFLVDRAGRRILLLVSMIGMTLCTIALGVYFFILESDPASADAIVWLPLTSLGVFLAFFAIGYGPVPWLMISEIYTSEYNAIVSPITGAFNWFFAFLITLSFIPISNAIGTGPTFWIFSGASFVGVLFTFFLVPETKGKTLNEIQRGLNGEKNISP